MDPFETPHCKPADVEYQGVEICNTYAIHTCTYEGVRSVSFPENLAYVLYE